MRIGTYNMISQIYGNSNTKKSSATSGTGYASFKDEVSFSSMGKDMQIAKNALATTPDVRESKVNQIKAKMESGAYQVSGEDFATKLMDMFNAKKVF